MRGRGCSSSPEVEPRWPLACNANVVALKPFAPITFNPDRAQGSQTRLEKLALPPKPHCLFLRGNIFGLLWPPCSKTLGQSFPGAAPRPWRNTALSHHTLPLEDPHKVQPPAPALCGVSPASPSPDVAPVGLAWGWCSGLEGLHPWPRRRGSFSLPVYK